MAHFGAFGVSLMESGITVSGFGTCPAGSLQLSPGDGDKELLGLAGSSFIPHSTLCPVSLLWFFHGALVFLIHLH